MNCSNRPLQHFTRPSNKVLKDSRAGGLDQSAGIRVRGTLLNWLPRLSRDSPHGFGRPAEASRALRKKLKHGSSHQQYRALVVGDRFMISLDVGPLPLYEGSSSRLLSRIADRNSRVRDIKYATTVLN